MTYQLLSGLHIGTAVSALIFGLCIFLTRKGTRLHKQFGYAYFFNMLGLNISVFAGTVIVFLIGGALIARGRGKYNFERWTSTRRSNAPLSMTEALKRRSATCSYGKQVDTLSTRSWFNGAIMWLSRNSRPVHGSTLIAARLCDPGPRFR